MLGCDDGRRAKRPWVQVSVCLDGCARGWCMKRMLREEGVATRARVALFNGTAVSATDALALDDEQINYDSLLKAGVKAVNILVAGIGPMSLAKRGFDTPVKLRMFGFDAGHLCDAAWCNEACMAYGRDALVAAFIVSASDAVAVTGSEAIQLLNITPLELLERCAGFPGEAAAVLQQLPHGISLRGVIPRVLLDSGLRVNALKVCGYGLQSVVDQTGASARDLTKLGFTI